MGYGLASDRKPEERILHRDTFAGALMRRPEVALRVGR